eukprot:TRINITY_DN39879_c0_g1_i1.p1 TRINITY_DN39879_c0_g1~~TRINITY_DN39879_c0_g1_i1.p1  ORF type:complete len:684 (+),score=243.74 TRINITY_DN39879_c0_g1_i1:105-2156(+)
MSHQFSYLATFGMHDFVTGAISLPPQCSIAQAFGAVLNKHHGEVVGLNDGAGSCLNEMYNAFIAHQGSIRITCHADDPRDPTSAVALQLSDVLQVCIDMARMSLRFHLDVDIGREGQSDYRRRLSRFYAFYNPTRLVALDGMLQDARGFEEHLMAALVQRYGAEPGASIDIRFRDRLCAFYHHYKKSKLPEIDEILVEYRGAEEQLFAALVAKYGPEPIIKGSDLGSDDSYTFASEDDVEMADPHPIAVPLMPFGEPLPDDELDGDDGDELTADVSFWDNFVNQVPYDSENAYGEGLDCNQALLRAHLRSYPILFRHIVTVSCPFKEEVFRANDQFWDYVRARAEAARGQLAEAAAAGGRHLVRVVTSLDPGAPAMMTRREWQLLAEDWEEAFDLARRVKVGSVALDAPPAPLRPGAIEPKPVPVPGGAVTKVAERCVQTVATTETQTGAQPRPAPAVTDRGTDPHQPPAPPQDARPPPRPLPIPPPAAGVRQRPALVALRPPPASAAPLVVAQPERSPPPPPEVAPPPACAEDGELEACLLDTLRIVRQGGGTPATVSPPPDCAVVSPSADSPWRSFPTPPHPDVGAREMGAAAGGKAARLLTRQHRREPGRGRSALVHARLRAEAARLHQMQGTGLSAALTSASSFDVPTTVGPADGGLPSPQWWEAMLRQMQGQSDGRRR